MIKQSSLIYKLYRFLILLLPFHTLAIYHVLGEYIPYIKYWKEVVIIIMITTMIISFFISSNNINYKYNIKLNITYLLIFAFFIYLLALYVVHPTIYGLYAIRNYLEPLIVLMLGLSIKFTSNEKEELIKLLVYISIIISIWGIYQQFFVSDQFLINIGYSADSNYPHLLHHSQYVAGSSLKRNIGTFSYANVFGVYLSLNIILLINFRNLFKQKIYYFLLSVLAFSLLLTFSRSSILSLLIIVAIFHSTFRQIKFYVLFILFTIILLNIIDNPISETLYKLIEKPITGKDPSTQGHLDSFIYSLSLIKENWFTGIDLGTVGPKAVQYTGRLIDIESSYFSLILDIGLFGFVLYTMIVASLIKNKISLEIILMTGIAFSFLPTIYELEIIIYLYMIIAVINSKTFQPYKISSNSSKGSKIEIKAAN